MKDRIYIVCTKAGSQKMLKTRPALEIGEQVIEVTLEVPDRLFLPPQIPTVQITLDDSHLAMPKVLTESVEALSGAGIRVKLLLDGEEG